MLVVSEAHLRYYLPARFDDELRLTTTVVEAKGARVVHRYELHRGTELLIEATTTIACVSKDGRVTRLPAWLRLG
jgi:acyl-CoA thioester hydrolase